MNKTTKIFILITFGMGALVLIANKMFASKKNPIIGRNIVVGDSHGVMISSKLKNAKADPLLSKSGWRVSDVIKALSLYPVSPDVANVFISVGVSHEVAPSLGVNHALIEFIYSVLASVLS